MKVIETEFDGLFILEPTVYGDARGHFFEAYNDKVLREVGINTQFVQDNQSYSVKNTIRGLHYQNAPHEQAKLVRVSRGVIIDVVVDLRHNKPTFGKTHSIELSAKNKKQLYIPKGFAHGFAALTHVDLLYKCDDYYCKEAESGIHCFDETLNIQWPIRFDEAILSEKDQALPSFASIG